MQQRAGAAAAAWARGPGGPRQAGGAGLSLLGWGAGAPSGPKAGRVLLAAGASSQLCFSPVKELGAVLAVGVSSSLLTQTFVLRSVGYRPSLPPSFPLPSLCAARGAERLPAGAGSGRPCPAGLSLGAAGTWAGGSDGAAGSPNHPAVP